jgi:uncharacterized damage-inducible protein DinB
MQPFFEDYLNNLQELHNDIQSTIEEFPRTALDWTPPGSSLNSLSVLIVHLTGAESYWLGDVVARESFGRDREAEFQEREMGLDALTDRLTDSLVYARRVLEKLTLQDLETSRISPRNGRQVTVAWALAHALKHTALHVGHIQITRQLWEQQARI